jgi:hypothetical protein
MLTLIFRPERRWPAASPRSHQTLAEPIHERLVSGRQILKEAVDRFDDDPPLGEAGDGAHGIESSFELDGHANAELRVILDLLSFPRTCWGTAGTTTIFDYAVVGHGRMRWRGTAEMRALRCASDACGFRRINASDNIMATMVQR